MKIKLTLLLLAVLFSQITQAYVLNLPSNTTYKNESCILELGKKTITRATMGWVIFQGATLSIHSEGRQDIIYHFTTADSEYNAQAISELAAFKGPEGRLSIKAEKLKDTNSSLAVHGAFTDQDGVENILFDCGVITY
jgi:hypothetical protein